METIHMRESPSQRMERSPKRSTKQVRPIYGGDDKKSDPLRVLDHGRKKLSTIESQRIFASFEECIKKSEIVSLLPYVIKNLDRFSVLLGADLVDYLREHERLQSAYADQIGFPLETAPKTTAASRSSAGSRRSTAAAGQAVTHSRHSFLSGAEPLPPIEPGRVTPGSLRSGQPSPSQKSEMTDIALSTPAPEEDEAAAEEKAKKMKALELQLHFSCRNVLRLFSSKPSAVTAVRAEFRERDAEASDMISYMNELKDVIFEMLLTTPLEEKNRNEYLSEISNKEKRNATIIDKMTKELDIATEEKNREISKRNDEIRRLKAELHQIEKFSEEHINRTKVEADKQIQADSRNSDGKQQKLQSELQTFKAQLAALIAENREQEQTLRKSKYRIETEVENWIQKYDQDMGDRQSEYEEVDSVYTEEKAQLNELEERFKTLEEEYKTIVEEKRIATEKREKEERELQAMIKAATIVQAFWRSFKVRKMLKGGKGKGKKGKKGKSGKKKK